MNILPKYERLLKSTVTDKNNLFETKKQFLSIQIEYLKLLNESRKSLSDLELSVSCNKKLVSES